MRSRLRRRRPAAAMRLQCEALERRAMLAVTADAYASSMMPFCWQDQEVSPLDNAFSAAALRGTSSMAAANPPSVTITPSGDNRIDALLGNGASKWGVTSLTFSFYAGGTYYGDETNPTPVSEAVKANVRYILSDVIAPLVGLTFTEVTDTPTSYGTLRYLSAPSFLNGDFYAYAIRPGTNLPPGMEDRCGDVVLSSDNDVAGTDTGSFRLGPGSYGFSSIIHETCHALGLKHPGNYNAGGGGQSPPFLPPGEDNSDNTQMTYNQFSGSEAATLMPYDILALQYLYPANTATRSTDTTYKFTAADAFSPGSVTSVAQPAKFGSSLKQMLWDGGGIDTVDCSKLPSDAGGYRIDVSPGGWITKTSAYNAKWYTTTSFDPWFLPGTPGNKYSATTYGTRLPLSGTVIENVVTSQSNDAIYLNSAANTVSGYTPGVSNGRDVISGSDQLDILDLSLFQRSRVTETQTGNDLVINLGTTGTITVKDYFAVPAGSRIQILYALEVSIAGATIVEGDTGTTLVDVVVSLTRTASQPVTLDYATVAGSAQAAIDYVAASGSLTFAPGETTKTIQIGIVGELLPEADETFTVQLSNVVNALTGSAGTVTIKDDDTPPALIVEAPEPVLEGDDGTTTVLVTVSLAATFNRTVTVSYSTADGSAQWATGDYIPASGMLTFAPGETVRTFEVEVVGDFLIERDETFIVQVTNLAPGVTSSASGAVTIVNDDFPPVISIEDITFVEGDGGTSVVYFPITLNVAQRSAVAIRYQTLDRTATSRDRDYRTGTGTAVIPAGELSTLVPITVTGDTKFEADETFVLRLLSAGAVPITRPMATCTIVNDDVEGVPTVSVGDVRQAEGNSAQKMFSFLVTLSAASTVPVSVDYATVDGTAVAGGDYGLTSGTLTFAPGMTRRSITVWVTGDTTVEASEQFSLVLGSASGATVVRDTGVGTILNDDKAAATVRRSLAAFAMLAAELPTSKPAARRR